MTKTIQNKTVAIVASDGFEQAELVEPKQALTEAGAEVHVISPDSGKIQGFRHFDKGDAVSVDKSIVDVRASDYDALVIPGGLFNPDKLRHDKHVLAFVSDFFQSGKPVAAICHGPWVLINAEMVEGRKMTSVGSIRKDLENAGAQWVDQEVVVDHNLVTSRTPDDLKAFCAALIELLAEHDGQARSAA